MSYMHESGPSGMVSARIATYGGYPSPPRVPRNPNSYQSHEHDNSHDQHVDDDDDDDDESADDVYTALKHVETAAAAADSASIITGQMASFHTLYHKDATDTVHEMHLALLYLLSHPEEFAKALQISPPRGATTLQEWNAEYDNESLLTDVESLVVPSPGIGGTSSSSSNHSPRRQQQQHHHSQLSSLSPNFSGMGNALSTPTSTSTSSRTQTATASPSTITPLPFVVFADDAEVVLPQAHTASQLFGVERIEGIELEAAAGISAISQLFLRWLGMYCQKRKRYIGNETKLCISFVVPRMAIHAYSVFECLHVLSLYCWTFQLTMCPINCVILNYYYIYNYDSVNARWGSFEYY
jgi:hypothetical protein